MRLAQVELRRIHLPLVSPFRTSFGVEHDRDVLLVRVTTDQGVHGWGECVAITEPLYSEEYVAGAQEVLREFLVPRLWPVEHLTALRVGPALAAVKGHRMAKAALEMAVLDAQLRGTGEPLAEYLGAERETVPAGVSVGIHDSVPELLDAVDGYLSEGYRRIKLKIEPGWVVDPVRAVRERFGDIPLQVDANAAFTLADADLLRALDPFELLLIEQPLAEDDLREHAELARLLRTPVCLDESITGAKAAADAIALRACRIINIKPGRVGGLIESRRIHDLCAASGVPVWCGGMLETGIGRAANLALAGLPNFTLPGDVSASARYWHRDITEPFTLHDGHMRIPTGPGLGVRVNEAWLGEVTTSVERLNPPER